MDSKQIFSLGGGYETKTIENNEDQKVIPNIKKKHLRLEKVGVFDPCGRSKSQSFTK